MVSPIDRTSQNTAMMSKKRSQSLRISEITAAKDQNNAITTVSPQTKIPKGKR
jgi:hypothetical protein